MRKSLAIVVTLLLLTVMSSNTVYAKNDTKKQSKGSTTLEQEVKELRETVKLMKLHNPHNAKPLKLTITAACLKGKTALGPKVQPGQIAISQDHAHLLHKWVYIQGKGKYFVADVMPNKWRNRVDIYTSTVAQAKQIGISERLVAVL